MNTEFSYNELVLISRLLRHKRKEILKSVEEVKHHHTEEFNIQVNNLKRVDNLYNKVDRYKRMAEIMDSDEYKERMGEEGLSADNKKIKIIKYNGSKNITVQFEDGQVLNRQSYNRFKNGKILSKEAYDKIKETKE